MVGVLLSWNLSSKLKVRKTHLKVLKTCDYLTFGYQIVHFSDFRVSNMHVFECQVFVTLIFGLSGLEFLSIFFVQNW